jgi:tRNA (guanine-N7-)-methyltransferase
MTRRKLDHYRFSAEADNVIEAGKPLYTQIKGQWNKIYFKNENPIVVELACGKGEYTIGLSAHFPDKNFIGMDLKGDRIARGSFSASEQNLTNVAFLRAGIQYADEFFDKGEVSEIWLIHPDPQVRARDEAKRLTNLRYLKDYAGFLKPNGRFCLKTDSTFLYDYTLETIEKSGSFKILEYTSDLYNSQLLDDHYGVTTHYERIFTAKGYTIKYINAVTI